MDTLLNRHRLTMNGLFDLSHLESHVCSHLQRVYACLAMGLLAAAAGAYIGMYLVPLYGLVAALASLGLLLYIQSGRDTFGPERHAAFAAFCALSGSGMAPLISLAIDMDPSILVNAIIITMVVTVCFCGAALLAKTSRWMMYLAGPLASGLTVLLLLSLANIFVRSPFMFDLTLKLTLLVFCGFMVYDTQKIVEMARMGDKDYISHCLDLFMDVVEVFRVVLILLMKQQDDGGKEKRKKSKN
ncbi:hypothetical protein BOX15_Mlig032418g1 [Macrostomum lignano]|uniref:Bax inhibitor 1 n=1 Tax=Macrostomum lignano TaxID=282301 RepID=A0A267EWE8_9PLAT|nr:hypothetical protein BOX15_Mlig032418g1 [Macrostomum lignano]